MDYVGVQCETCDHLGPLRPVDLVDPCLHLLDILPQPAFDGGATVEEDLSQR